jgi:hypothetical protein
MKVNAFHVGPGYYGGESVDDICFFANLMHLNYNQAMQLRRNYDNNPRPLIKHYVYKLTHSSVVFKKCKMVSVLLNFFCYICKVHCPFAES